MSSTTVTALASTSICIILAIIFFIKAIMAKRDGENRISRRYGFCGLLATYCVIGFGGFLIEAAIIDKAEICIRNGYDVYIDGEEVDATKVNLNSYSVLINSELQEIYLTPYYKE